MSIASRFTFLEKVVLAGVVGLGIGAAIPLGGVLRSRKYIDQMKVQLLAVATQQESYLYDHAVYAGAEDRLVAHTPVASITIVIREATTTGWSATASHQQSGVQCSLFAGNAAPVGGATREGIVACG